MPVRYIFNSHGDYVAFIQDDHLFDPDATWLGFIANGNQVYNPQGLFVGYVFDDDRIIRRPNDPHARMLPPLRPLRPLKPLRPLRRHAMPPLPNPWQDVFLQTAQATFAPEPPDLSHLEGATILSNDGECLGTVTRNRHQQDSISNPYGPHGSRYRPTSIWNPYGRFGSRYSPTSCFNPHAATPPIIRQRTGKQHFLTTNIHKRPRVDPNNLAAWLEIEVPQR